MKYLLVFSTILIGLNLHADELENKSTLIGDSTNPKSEFIVCAAQKAVATAHGTDRKILVYAHVAPVGKEIPPTVVSLMFVTQVIETGKKNIIQLELTSTDTEKKWQYVTDESGEIYFFSAKVSASAQLKSSSNDLIANVDLTDCK